MFDDAHLDNAVKGVISGIFAATGQTCIASSRLLVQENIHNQFVEKLVAFARTAKMGDPMSLSTQVGPVLSVIPFRDEEDAIAIGNDIVFGLAAGVWISTATEVPDPFIMR